MIAVWLVRVLLLLNHLYELGGRQFSVVGMAMGNAACVISDSASCGFSYNGFWQTGLSYLGKHSMVINFV